MSAKCRSLKILNMNNCIMVSAKATQRRCLVSN